MSARVYNTLNANGRDRQDVVTTTLLLVLFFAAFMFFLMYLYAKAKKYATIVRRREPR